MGGRIGPKFVLRIFLIEDYVLNYLRCHLAQRHFSPSYPATAFTHYSIFHNWRFKKSIPLISQVIQELYPLNRSLYKIDRYLYKNFPYLDIFHKGPVQYTHQINSNVAPSQASHVILPTQPLSDSRRTLRIYTDASKTNDRYSIAFYSPHNLEIQGQFQYL